MAIGITTIKTVGRLVFDLQRDEETTTRTIDLPQPLMNQELAQQRLDQLKPNFVDNVNGKLIIQPANWRDDDVSNSDPWTTMAMRYEIIETAVTPIIPTPAE